MADGLPPMSRELVVGINEKKGCAMDMAIGKSSSTN